MKIDDKGIATRRACLATSTSTLPCPAPRRSPRRCKEQVTLGRMHEPRVYVCGALNNGVTPVPVHGRRRLLMIRRAAR